MNRHESTYHFKNTGAGTEAELARLHSQVHMSWEKEFRLLRWFGLKDGMHILEAGCGPGFYTEQLLDHWPGSKVTALDVDGFLLDQARNRTKDIPAHQLQFVQASIMETGVKDQTFDFIIVRLLFLHLYEPLKAAVELYRVLKPGGKLVIIDIDDGVFGTLSPEMESLPVIMSKLAASQKKNGGNRHMGRALPRLLKEAGFIHVDLEAVVQHTEIAGKDGFSRQLDPKRFECFLQRGVITQEEFKQMKSWYKAFQERSDASAMMIFLMACGTKPCSKE
ncbi:class I SAM-dependent methyltransferase [Paenibacillus sp. 32352]|uniref:class I SAM-dependent methyltransferase n=1 Tax=Paenibacillus sp. 32352 TaxID=1969111 RepID=UPI0009AF0807|nr:methyltransferase domain-containing protein [Paenibacillus sp. 32352]